MKKICIVISTYNSEITKKIYESAVKELSKSGYKEITTIEVPGSFEIPVTISRLVDNYDGFVDGCDSLNDRGKRLRYPCLAGGFKSIFSAWNDEWVGNSSSSYHL